MLISCPMFDTNDLKKVSGLSLIKDLVDGDQSLSRIYGFILYTESDPFVVKVLKDDDFWNALNDLSGVNWPIFAVRPLIQGCRTIIGPSKYNSIGFLVSSWDEPKQNLPLLNEFDLDKSEDLPCFVAFMWDDKENLQEIVVPINGSSIEECYKSIKKIVKTITNAEKNVLPEFKHSETVFRNVKADLEAIQVQSKWWNRGKKVLRIFEFLKP